MVDFKPLSAQTHAHLVSWTNLTEVDTDPPFTIEPFRSDITVGVWGTFNGGTVQFQGSLQTGDELKMETPVWFILTDMLTGDPLSFTDNGAGLVKENMMAIRAIVSAGAGVDVTARALSTGNRGK